MGKKGKLKEDDFIGFGQKLGGVVGIAQQVAQHTTALAEYSTALANSLTNKFLPDNKKEEVNQNKEEVNQNEDFCSQCLRKHDETSRKRDKSEIKNEKKGVKEGVKKLAKGMNVGADISGRFFTYQQLGGLAGAGIHQMVTCRGFLKNAKGKSKTTLTASRKEGIKTIGEKKNLIKNEKMFRNRKVVIE